MGLKGGSSIIELLYPCSLADIDDTEVVGLTGGSSLPARIDDYA
jgi:hypothetical protein